MTDPVEIIIPIRLVNITNLREHWSARAKRAKAHRAAAVMVPKWSHLPCRVTITRIAPRKLDTEDNLNISCKSLRDGIADRIGIDDGDDRIKWVYDQRRGLPKQYAAHVRIEAI